MSDMARTVGALLGLAVGDAVGTTVEFRARGTFTPVTEMNGGGPFKLPPGAWTDDTSMALCLGTSLIISQGFDPEDQMLRYVRWWHQGYMSSIGVCFDIGTATAAALERFVVTGDPFSGSTDPMSAGNGSIMRLAPVPIYYWRDFDQAVAQSGESSRTTHAAQECISACRLFGAMQWRALNGASKTEILSTPYPIGKLPTKLQAIADGNYLGKSVDDIRGSGYVVESLEAALWCFATTNSFRDAVLTAVNLGDDADTTAAVCGQLAGAFYGADAIPADWRAKVVMRVEIERLATKLSAGGEGK